MSHKPIDLTIVDKEILNSYRITIDGLSEYYGKSYEMVLHSLENLESSVIYIVNGEHTGRKVGAPITNMALKMLEKLSDNSNNSISYFTKNKIGAPLKSTTIAIRGEKDRIIGLLCINCYLNTSFIDFVEEYFPQKKTHTIESVNETFGEKREDLVKATLNEIIDTVNNDERIKLSNRNREIIKRLHQLGLFNIKNSVVDVSRTMGISKNTVYLHLRNIKK